MKLNQKWFATSELAGMPGMPGTKEGVFKRVKKRLYVSRLRADGKGFEYALSSLPEVTQAYLKDAIAAHEKAITPKQKQPVAPVTQAHAATQFDEPLALLRQIAADIARVKELAERTDRYGLPIFTMP